MSIGPSFCRVGILLAILFAGLSPSSARAGLWERDSLTPGSPGKQSLVLDLYKMFQDAKRKGVGARKVALERVLARVRAALATHRDQAIYWYLLGLVLGEMDSPETEAAFLEARRRGPLGPLAAGVSFQLALLYVKRHRCDLALAEYRRSSVLATNSSEKSVVFSNSAECEMTLGRLSQAIADYRRALALNPESSAARWGLAVALDRDGRGREALRVARAALATDPKRLSLVGPGVFFVPPVEVEYYLALADLAQGSKRRAAGRWEKYLDGFPGSLWRLRAQQHLIRLGRRPVGWRVVVRTLGRSRGRRAVPAGLRKALGAAVKHCLAGMRPDVTAEMRFRLRVRADGRGRLRSLGVWPVGPWRTCLRRGLEGRRVTGVSEQILEQAVFVLTAWGNAASRSTEVPVRAGGRPSR